MFVESIIEMANLVKMEMISCETQTQVKFCWWSAKFDLGLGFTEKIHV